MVHETVKMGADNPDNHYMNATISGDFDIRVDLDEIELPTPNAGLLANVYLQMRLRDKKQSRPTLVR